MGQFYLIVNLDKGEYIDPGEFGYGRKFYEFSGSAVMIILAFMIAPGYCGKFATWAGDRIVYACDGYDAPNESEYIESFLKSINQPNAKIPSFYENGSEIEEYNDNDKPLLYYTALKYGTSVGYEVVKKFNIVL